MIPAYTEIRTLLWCKLCGHWQHHPDSKVHGANMGPTWTLSAPDEPHVGPMNLAIRVVVLIKLASWQLSVVSAPLHGKSCPITLDINALHQINSLFPRPFRENITCIQTLWDVMNAILLHSKSRCWIMNVFINAYGGMVHYIIRGNQYYGYWGPINARIQSNWQHGSDLILEDCALGHLLLTWINFDLNSNYIHYKVWERITYPFPNFNVMTTEAWEWINNFMIFIPQFTGYGISHPCRD